MTSIVIVDHGAGNLVSIAQGLERVGAMVRIADRPEDLFPADGVVLPGVGSAATAWDRLDEQGLVGPLRTLPVPLLGICVGLQLLFEGSDESEAGGLALISGRVELLEDTPRLPHTGWNDLEVLRSDPLLEDVDSGEPFYFVHSYAPVATDPETIVATASYGSRFTAVARRGDVAGVQFHPERSGTAGLQVLANFVSSCREVANVA